MDVQWTEDLIKAKLKRFNHDVTLPVNGGEIDIRLRDGVLLIYGSGTLLVKPKASNAIEVRIES